MLRVRTAFTGLTGAPYLNTLYFSGNSQAAADAAAAAAAAFWTTVDNQITSAVSWNVEDEVAEIAPNGQLTGVFVVNGGSGQGAEAQEPLPFASQVLVRWSTSSFLGGRQIRGRTFVPGMTELANTSGSVSSTVQSNIQGAINTLLADPDSTLVVWSRVNLAEVPVDQGSVWGQFAVLTSRRD